jgi:hypothetical protein
MVRALMNKFHDRMQQKICTKSLIAKAPEKSAIKLS